MTTPSTLRQRFYRFGLWWDRFSLWPLIALGVILAILMTIPALIDGATVDLDGGDAYAAAARDVTPWVWGVFVFDVAIRFLAAPRRMAFVKSHWVELVAVALPFLPHLSVLKLLSVFLILASRMRAAVSRQIVVYALSTSVISWYVLGLGITEAEGPTGNPIASLTDGLWWSSELLTTGAGFDQNFPITEAGRVIGAMGFLLSYAVIGGVTAALVAWLVSVGRKEDDEELLQEIEEDSNDIALLRDDVAALRDDVRALHEEIARLRNPDDTD